MFGIAPVFFRVCRGEKRLICSGLVRECFGTAMGLLRKFAKDLRRWSGVGAAHTQVRPEGKAPGLAALWQRNGSNLAG
jgi:hypothetical protein